MISCRETSRAILRAIGAALLRSDQSTDWFTLPEYAAAQFYGVRFSIPFTTLLCHHKDGGLVVYYDRPARELESTPAPPR